MAFLKINNGFPTSTSWHTHLIPIISDFLLSEGWTQDSYVVTSSTDWKLVMSKGGVSFYIGYKDTASIYVTCGHAYEGSSLLGSSYTSADLYGQRYYRTQMYDNPDTIYLISGESSFILMCPYNVGNQASTVHAGSWFFVGMCNKLGTYSGGRCVLKQYERSVPDSGSRHAFQIGDIGSYGIAPYMWSSTGTSWTVDLDDVKSGFYIGRTNNSSFSTALLPMHIKAYDFDASLWRIVGTVPGILKAYSYGVHYNEDVIDHLGKQWICFNGGDYNEDRPDLIHTLFQLD